jgi:hypothetical protein
MPQIDISDDTADALFRDILITDYRGLRTQIYELRARGELPDFEQEDLENAIRYYEAIKIMMEYYLPHHELADILDQE